MINVLNVTYNSLSLTLSIPTTQQDMLFSMTTIPFESISYVENKFQFGHIWKTQAQFRCLSLSWLESPSKIAKTSLLLKESYATSPHLKYLIASPFDLQSNFHYFATCCNYSWCVLSYCNKNKLDYKFRSVPFVTTMKNKAFFMSILRYN